MLVINQYYDTVEASGQVLKQLCEGLADRFDITVIAAPPAPGWQTTPHPRVLVRRVPSARFARGSLVLRAINYLTFLLGVCALLPTGRRPDVVLTMTDPPVIGLLGLLGARMRRARVAIVFQDVHPDLGLATGELTGRPIVTAMRVVQRALLTRADRVIAISDGMRERLEVLGAPSEAVRVVPNWADLDVIRPAPRDNPWARRHGLTSHFTVMHAGNVGMLQGLDLLIEVAPTLPDVQFVIVGGGSRKRALVAAADRQRIRNLVFIDHQPAADLPFVLASADVQLVSLRAGVRGLIEPSKIYGILAAGRPAIVAADPESDAARLVTEAGAGEVIPPADPRALTRAVTRLSHLGSDEIEEMGQRARAIAERSRTRQGAVRAYSGILSELSTRSRP